MVEFGENWGWVTRWGDRFGDQLGGWVMRLEDQLGRFWGGVMRFQDHLGGGVCVGGCICNPLGYSGTPTPSLGGGSSVVYAPRGRGGVGIKI